MKYKDIIQRLNLKKGKQAFNLDQVYPIIPISNESIKVSYYIDDIEQTLFDETIYANRLNIESSENIAIDLLVGKGYIASKQDELTLKFISNHEWSGGDGIYSFNLEDSNDQFDQEKIKKTLFVFGDTFVGESDPNDYRRFQPHLMPNNSYAYFNGKDVEFKLNWQNNGSIDAFYKLNTVLDEEGTIARNLITYDQKKNKNAYLSSYHQKQVVLDFDLYKSRYVSHISIYNYFSEEEIYLNRRGFKKIEILGSNDDISYQLIHTVELEKATSFEDFNYIDIKHTYRYLKIIGLSNHHDDSYDEGLFGLHLVKFYNDTQQYRDIDVHANSTLMINQSHGWIWLQDGVIINDNLYFLPLLVNSDQTQPEGLQFKITGVAMFKTPIKNQKIITEESTQKIAPLLVYDKDSEYLFGAGIMANTKEAGAKHPDGYIYIYGYKTTMGLREMIVARVKQEDFENFDDWRYFDGNDFSTNIFDSKPLLGHISCELSVSPLNAGLYKGKYIAVFTYDVNTKYVSFAIGDTPVGPFTQPQRVYVTPEQEIFKSTTYTYNAKAHPHLSSSTDILVSYNTNTYSLDHNYSNYLVYRPRFIILHDTTK